MGLNGGDFSQMTALAQDARKRGERAAALEHFRAASALAPEKLWVLIEIGAELRDLGRLDEAEALFRDLLAKAPHWSQAWLGLARVARKRGDRAAALDAFREAAAFEPENIRIGYDIAEECRELGRLDEAEAAYRDIVAKDPNWPQPWLGLAHVARKRGDRAAALEDFRQAAALEPNNTRILYQVAEECRELGRLDEAEAAYRDIAAKDPNWPQPWLGLAHVARRRGERAAAIEAFRQAAALEPDNIRILYHVAEEYRELGRLDEAEAACREIVAKESEFAGAWRGLGLVTRRRGDRAAALEAFRKAAALEPDQIINRRLIAEECRELGRLDEAEAIYRDVVAKDPQFAEAWTGLAFIARGRGDRLSALEKFRKAAAIDPANAGTHCAVAVELRELGRFDEAEAIYRDLVVKDPQFAQAWTGLAMIARGRGDHLAALEKFRQAAAIDPANAGTQCGIADELYQLGRIDEASGVFAEVVAKDSNIASAWHGLGLIARQRGERLLALEHFRRAANLEPHHAGRQRELATSLRELGRFDEAEAVLAALVERSPQSAEAWLTYAHGLRRRSSAFETLAIIEKAHALAPGRREARLALAGEYLRHWRIQEADELYDAILSGHEEDIAALIGKGQVMRRRGDAVAALEYYRLAASAPAATEATVCEYSRELQDAGQFLEADRILQEAIARNPRQPAFHMRAGHNARARGDRAGARQAFARADELSPGQAHIATEIATEDFFLGRTSQAIVALQDVLSRHPRNAQAFGALALFADLLDDIGSAIALRKRVLEIDSSNPGISIQLALTLAKLGRLAEAREILAQCEARFGSLPEIYSTRARLLSERGDFPQAASTLQMGITKFPRHFELWAQKVALSTSLGAFDEAWQAIEAWPKASAREMTRIHHLRGQIEMARWRPDRALKHFLEGLKLNPSEFSLGERAARASILAADVEASQKSLNASVRGNPSHRLFHGGVFRPTQSVLGQLIDEYRLDKASLALLRAGLASRDPIAALAAPVRETPDYTPFALHFLVELRRAGVFALSGGEGAKGASLFPRQIAQYWDEDIPDDVRALSDEWRATHPDFSYQLFSKADARAYIRDTGIRGAAEAFERVKEPASQADLFRLIWLHRAGGFYADADDRCIAPISTIDPGGKDLILHQEDFGTAGNNFIAATPGHPVIEEALKSAIQAINRGDSDVVWLATGPGLLTRTFARYLAEGSAFRFHRTLFLDSHELRRAVALHSTVSYKYTPRHWSRSVFRRRHGRATAQIAEIAALEA